MRKAYSNQMRLDGVPIENVELNFNVRDSIIPVLTALQHREMKSLQDTFNNGVKRLWQRCVNRSTLDFLRTSNANL